MTYRLSNREVELLLSFYRDIQKYNNLLEMERKTAHYGVNSQIYAAFKLNRVSEKTKLSFINDYCSIIKKANKAWENAIRRGTASEREHKNYLAIQMMFIAKNESKNIIASAKVGCCQSNFRRDHIDKGIEFFKSYLTKQLFKMNYSQSDSQSIIVGDEYQYEYSRNLELLFYVVYNVSRKYRNYFMKAEWLERVDSSNMSKTNQNAIEMKEAS